MLSSVTYDLSKVTGHVLASPSETLNWSKVTCGDEAHHLYLRGDGRQLQVTLMRVTIGRFLRSVFLFKNVKLIPLKPFELQFVPGNPM